MNKEAQRKYKTIATKGRAFTVLSSIITITFLVSLTNLIRSLQATHHTPSESIINSKIPRKLWFTYKDDLLKTKQPTHYYENVMKTIDAYRKAWGDPDAEAHVLSDDDCSKILIQINKELLERFKAETVGAYKGDICRLGALYLYGGYYFDVDMQIVTPYIVPSDVSFSTSTAVHGYIFNSFMASTPKHRILEFYLEETLIFYDDKDAHLCLEHNNLRLLGPCLLNVAYTRYMNYISKAEEKTIYLLHEYESPSGLSYCGFEVSDPISGKRHFFSRIKDSEGCSS